MAESYNTNLLNVASCYVKQLEIPITHTTLKERLSENAYYPSLFSLSNIFEMHKIEIYFIKIFFGQKMQEMIRTCLKKSWLF